MRTNIQRSLTSQFRRIAFDQNCPCFSLSIGVQSFPWLWNHSGKLGSSVIQRGANSPPSTASLHHDGCEKSIILTSERALTLSDVAELEQIQRELQRRDGVEHCGCRAVS